MRSFTARSRNVSTLSSMLASSIQRDPIQSVSCRSMYGLKQAPHSWYMRFANFIRSISFTERLSNTSLFVLRRGSSMAYLQIHMDDMIITASSDTLQRRLIHQLRGEFAIKDMGPVQYFLGIHVRRTSRRFLSISESVCRRATFFKELFIPLTHRLSRIADH